MSTKYQSSKEVPTETLIKRLKELSDAVAGGSKTQEREFTMRIPAECDRDADIVIDEAARRLQQAEARVAELLTIAQAVHRDLLLRAEPDWDGSGGKVVNLSAGFWDELNRVLGNYTDAGGKSFDAMLLRKQAELFEIEASNTKLSLYRYWLRCSTQRLRQQAEEMEGNR